jgi:hypothetical protein
LLWNKAVEAIAYLNEIIPKCIHKEMLMAYLIKNQNTIINYEKIQKVGKTIGSGRTEKQNYILVAKRQKYNGMPWSLTGLIASTLNAAGCL